MKSIKIIAIAAAFIALTSCKKEEVKNCGCDKITTYTAQFNYSPDSYKAKITTVNECSGFKKITEIEGEGHGVPEQGTCF